MGTDKRTLVLFPGAWGNQTELVARWWFRNVINYFSDYQIVVVTYKGESMNEMVLHAIRQLEPVPNGSLALAYSMGAQIARGVAVRRTDLFKKVALISGLERFGVRFSVLLTSLTFALRPILRTLFGKPLMLDTQSQVRRIFAQATQEDDAKSLSTELFDRHMHAESGWTSIQMFLPPLRVWMPRFPCPVMAIIPEHDFLLPSPTYRGEQVQKIRVTGDHSLLCGSETRLRLHLMRLRSWFELP